MSKQQSMWKLSALLGCTALAGIMACTVTTTDGPNTGDDDDDTTSSSSSSSSSSGATSSSSGDVDSGAETCNVLVEEACAACLNENCVDETKQCFCDSGNATCATLDAAYSACIEQNPDDEAAQKTCFDKADTDNAAGVDDWNKWAACSIDKCASTCGAE